MPTGTIGVEAVANYNGLSGRSDLFCTVEQAMLFSAALDGTNVFSWYNNSAWDEDFEELGRAGPIQGTDVLWADAVDIIFFSGHGGPEDIWFGVLGHDNGKASHLEMRLGDKSCKWLVLDACLVLYNLDFDPGDSLNTGAISRWKGVFAGLHYLLSFASQSTDGSYRGQVFAGYLNANYSVRSAWRHACQETEPTIDGGGIPREWSYLRADTGSNATYSDHWIGHGFVSQKPYPANHHYLVWGSC